MALGSEIACGGHLIEVIKQFEEAKHGLTYRLLTTRINKITQLDSKLKTMGTKVYLGFMRDIRDAFFNKTLSPLRPIYLIWKAVFIFRIW